MNIFLFLFFVVFVVKLSNAILVAFKPFLKNTPSRREKLIYRGNFLTYFR